MRRLLFVLLLCFCGCALFRQPPTLNEVSGRAVAQISPGPTLYWDPVSGAKSYRVWRCALNACATKSYTVGAVMKPFPVTLANWQMVTEISYATGVLSYPADCAFEYSVQAIGPGRKIANGGNVVRCGQ